jgi:5-methylcytosine-specific restriction endonuclease McrA
MHRKIVHHAMSFHCPDRRYYFSDSVYPLRGSPNLRVVRWRDLAIKLAGLCGFGADHNTVRDWWEADHIVERVRGGNNKLENLRTLCLRCHRVETARLARERADERRMVREPRSVAPAPSR